MQGRNITIETEADATPLVRIFATKFRAAVQLPDYVALVRRANGQFGLKSSTDPSALTVTISDDNILLERGIHQDCDIVIHLDFNQPNKKPSIDGLLRHPLYAITVGKLLDFPTINWADALKRLWEHYKDYPGMPTGITVKSLDEDRQLSVGKADNAMYLEGQSSDLAEVFTGGGPLIQQLAAGKLHGNYLFQHAVVMSDVTLQMMLGEGP